jgi:hypothetical protein
VPPAVSGWALLKTLGKKNTALAPLKGAAEAQKKLQPVPHKGIRSLKLKLAALQGMQSMHNSQHHNNALMMSGETGNAGRTIELQRRLGARGEAEKAAEILAERRAAEDAALEAAEMKTHTGVDEEPEAEKLKYIPELHLEKVGRDGRPHTVLFEGSIFVYVVTCVAYACVAALYTVNSVSFEQLVV